MKLIIGAGGSGGHIIPAIAVAEELRKRGWEVIFIGNKNSMEEKLSSKYNFTFYPIKVQKLYRNISISNLLFPLYLVYSIILSFNYINKIKPIAILCTGGFVSGPVAIAGILLKKVLYFQDGNSFPGLTTRILAKFTNNIFIANEESKQYLDTAKCVVTGNPILSKSKIDRDIIKWRELKLQPHTKKLFVIGGSQGSHSINEVVKECIDDFLSLGLEVIWQTGKADYSILEQQFRDTKGVYLFDFSTQINLFYSIADIAVSRAGALSIAELEFHGIPSLLIPLPNSAGNHQWHNAKTQERKGVGVVLEQRNLNKANLLMHIRELLQKITLFKESFNKIPPNTATEQIVEIIISQANADLKNLYEV